ncbi:hypothetical protein D9M72_514010 [compost metagenome]
MAAHPHSAAGDVVEAVDERDDAGLARARCADQGHGLIGRDTQVDVVQHGLPGAVAEAHAVEHDLGLEVGRQRNGAGLLLHGDRHVQHLEDPLASGHGTLHHCVLHRQGSDRIEEALHVEDIGHHHAHTERAVQHRAPAEDDHYRHRQAGEHVHCRHHDLRSVRRADLRVEVLGRAHLIAQQVGGLPPSLLHRTDAVDVFRERSIHARGGFSCAAEFLASPRDPGEPHEH